MKPHLQHKRPKAFNLELWWSFLDILFPISCLGCGTGLSGRRQISYCRKCLNSIRFIRAPFCTVCGIPFVKSGGRNHLCGYCLVESWHFSRARAAVWYQPPVAEALRNFKYQGKMHGLKSFAVLTELFFQKCLLPPSDLVLPVPLHVKRLRQRGFNQALILARRFFPQYLHLINPRVLERHHWLRPQTGLKGSERRRNVKNAFRIKRPELVLNKKILLIDDVFTTGATVNECARILRQAGAEEITVFTFARVIASS